MALLATRTGDAAPVAGTLHAFEVELPVELQVLAGSGRRTPVTHAKVTIGVPDGIEVSGDTPVLVINATADPGYNPSRFFLRLYEDAALASGWIVLAADPSQERGRSQGAFSRRRAFVDEAMSRSPSIF